MPTQPHVQVAEERWFKDLDPSSEWHRRDQKGKAPVQYNTASPKPSPRVLPGDLRRLACSISCQGDWREDTRQLENRQTVQIHPGTTDPVDQAELLGLSAGLKSLARSPRGRKGPAKSSHPVSLRRERKRKKKRHYVCNILLSGGDGARGKNHFQGTRHSSPLRAGDGVAPSRKKHSGSLSSLADVHKQP